MPSFENQTVLVTGGGGFIGSKLAEKISARGPQTVRVFDSDEQKLCQLKQRADEYETDLQFVLGDVRDPKRVETAMEGVDVVFHAAAIKRVEVSEYNPFEAIRTNVIGTQNVVRAALKEGVDSFVAVSTDKASNPNSVMGATKLIMERIVVAANDTTTRHGTRFNCVRFGNVLGSTGSVVPIFKRQIETGGPITVTNPDMTRFIMSNDNAVELILNAHDRMTAGEVCVLKMPAFRVGDLARGLRAEYAPAAGYDPEDVKIKIVGKRPGERMHEKLVSRDELPVTQELDDMFVIFPEIDIEPKELAYEVDNSLDGEYTSDEARLLSQDELVEMVKQAEITPTLVNRWA